MSVSRRNLLALACIAPLVRPAVALGQARCEGPLTMSQRNRRRAIGYVEKSPSAEKQCRKCSFFSNEVEGCGNCQMLSGGTVNATGVCNSFARK